MPRRFSFRHCCCSACNQCLPRLSYRGSAAHPRFGLLPWCFSRRRFLLATHTRTCWRESCDRFTPPSFTSRSSPPHLSCCQLASLTVLARLQKTGCCSGSLP